MELIEVPCSCNTSNRSACGLFILQAEIVPDQEKALKQMSNSFGNLSCFPSQRSGKMNKNESELFSKIRQACIENDIVKLNTYLFIKEDELLIECTNDESTYFEPNVPISKFTISNKSNRSIPLIDFQISNNGWSTTADNGRWILDYEIGMKNNPSYIKILQPGEEYTHEVPLDVRGYGKQVICNVIRQNSFELMSMLLCKILIISMRLFSPILKNIKWLP